jgi:hypothetical protein
MIEKNGPHLLQAIFLLKMMVQEGLNHLIKTIIDLVWNFYRCGGEICQLIV